jgi:hypothetical protein
MNDFLHECANMAWSTKGARSRLLILHSFYRLKVSMVIKKIQVVIIFHSIVMVTGKAFSKLNVFPKFSPITLFNLFQLMSSYSDGFTSSLIKSGKLKINTTYTTFKVECEPLLRNMLENVQILSGVQIWLNRSRCQILTSSNTFIFYFIYPL